MRVVALGPGSFITAFKLAGIEGVEAPSAGDALKAVRQLSRNRDVSLILLNDEYSRELGEELTEIKAAQAIPLIYSVPSPGAKKLEKIEYRELLKRILGF